MPIDPTVALQAGVGVPPPSPGINLGQIAGAANAIMQLQDEQRARAQQNALQQLMQQPDALDKAGLPTQNTLAQAMRISPQYGMQLGQNADRMRLLQSETHRQKLGRIGDIWRDSYAADDEARAAGGNEAAGTDAGQRKYTELLKEAVGSGWLTEAEMQQLPQNYSRQHAILASQSVQDFLALQDKAAAARRAEGRDERQIAADKRAADAAVRASQPKPGSTDEERSTRFFETKRDHPDWTESQVWDAVNEATSTSKVAGGNFTDQESDLLGALIERGVSIPAGRGMRQQKAMLDGLI